jgi:hypothetical protein
VGDHAFYSSKALEPVAEPPLEAVLRLADQSGMSVRIGLAHDPEFWDRIKPAEPVDRVQAYLQLLRMRSLRVARELAPLVSGHRSFDGWFVTEEVDDVNWIQPERRALLRSHLRDLSNALGELTPRKSVAISGFSNAHSDPATLEAFWLELLDGIRVDLVLFQDGIGAHKLTLDSAGPYLRAMKRATTRSARALSIVVELFEQIAGPPVSSGPFKAVSTGVDRLTRQLVLAGESSTAGVVAFSVPDYMVRGAGPSALQLFTEYAALVAGGSSGQDQELWSGRPTEK